MCSRVRVFNLYLLNVSFMSFEWHKSCFVISYVTNMAAPSGNIGKKKTHNKSHEPPWSVKQRKPKERVEKHRPIWARVPPGLPGERTVCVLNLFLLPARGHQSPDPAKTNKRALHWLLWRCCAITTSDCSADKREKVPSTKKKRIFLFLEYFWGE